MIRWTQTFGGGYRADAGDFAMSVYWGMHDGEKWMARANGTQLPGTFATVEEAQRAAIAALRAQLRRGLAALPKVKR